MPEDHPSSSRSVSWKHHLKYLGYRAITFLCNWLPQRFLYWIALRVGDINWWLDQKGREAVESNLRHVLPDAPEVRIRYEARWVFRNFGKYLTEFFRFRRMDHSFFDKHVAFWGHEYIEEALKLEKGVIMVSAHLSNWELGCGATRHVFGRPTNVVIQRHLYKKADDLFMRERAAHGVNCIPLDHAPLHVLRHLKQGEIVCMLGDRDPTGQGIVIEFFGRPCRFPQGPARFAIKSGSPIIPCFASRRSNDSFTIWCLPPVPVPETGTRDEKVRAMIQSYANEFEKMIQIHPEEWPAFYRFWDEEWKF